MFRRHRRRCPHAAKGREWRRCSCPISVEGTLPDGSDVRKSLNTGNWELATEMARAIETGDVIKAITISDAVERFLADAAARKLSESSLKKYRVLLQGRRGDERTSPTLEEFAEDSGYRLLSQLDVDVLRRFRERWKDGPLAAKKKLERLRSFFRFAAESKWIRDNPAVAVKPPLLHENPTQPLDDDELEKIYATLPHFIAERKAAARGQATGSDHLDRLKALLLLLEHTGLRIVDAVQLGTRQVLNGRLLLRAQKNQGEINLPIPPKVLAELQGLSPQEPGLFFWSGEGKPETAAGNYRRTLRDLGGYCGVSNLHPHRLRDTFAVRLLQNGAPLDRVARALGNRSVRVVERHYAPWIKSRQDELDVDVKATWGSGSNPRRRLVRVK
jgi:integrase/recombinase XerD